MQTSLVVEQCTIADLELAPTMAALIEEYAAESSIKGLPPHNAKAELYKLLESSGTLYVLRAVMEGELVGFLLMLTPVIPHYGVYLSTTESFFVSKLWRRTGAGIHLLQAAEKRAKELGSPVLLISTPIDGQLDEWLALHKNYRATNRTYCRSFTE